MTRELRESLEDYFMGRRKAEDDSVTISRETVWLSSGCDVLDLVVGGGAGYGYPAGKIINIVGDKSSGKSLLAAELIASAHHHYGEKCKWIYDDTESGFTFNTQSLFGIEIVPEDPDKRICSGTVEDLYCNIRLFLEELKPEEFGIYVIDSLDGLSSEETDKLADKRVREFKKGKRSSKEEEIKEEEDEKKKKGSYRMGAAKYLSQEFFRTLHAELRNRKVLLVFISQIRMNIDSFSFEKYTRAGGKALDFFAYCVLWLWHLSDIEKKEISVGGVVRAKTKKLKAPRQFECTFSYFTDYGIDNIGTSLDYLFGLRGERGKLLAASKAIKYWPDRDPISRSALLEMIDQDSQLQQELRERVRAHWKVIEQEIRTVRSPKYGNSQS